MNLQSVRGFRDLLPETAESFLSLEKIARRQFALYGYRELRIPTVEFDELFRKSTGETTDIVEKEMFTLQDSGGRLLALRPEGTPGVVRAYLENSIHKQKSYAKFFYVGSMFRAERPQAGRFREFEQIGVEYLGNPSPCADVEVILLLKSILEEFGLGKEDYDIHLNNLGCEKPECRPSYRASLLEYLSSRSQELCENCQKRISRNPLRALDCKIDGPKMLHSVPVFSACADCEGYIKEVVELLQENSCHFVYPSRNLVRGLDYYNRTVFEFKAKTHLAQDAVAGGGRYDNLVEGMGGPSTPAVGWAIGVDRTVMLLEDLKKPLAEGKGIQVYVAAMGKEASQSAFHLLQEVRRNGIPAEGGLFHKSLKAQLRDANSLKALYALILGEDEIKAGKCAVKDMSQNTQVIISRDDVLRYLKQKIG